MVTSANEPKGLNQAGPVAAGCLRLEAVIMAASSATKNVARVELLWDVPLIHDVAKCWEDAATLTREYFVAQGYTELAQVDFHGDPETFVLLSVRPLPAHTKAAVLSRSSDWKEGDDGDV